MNIRHQFLVVVLGCVVVVVVVAVLFALFCIKFTVSDLFELFKRGE